MDYDILGFKKYLKFQRYSKIKSRKLIKLFVVLNLLIIDINFTNLHLKKDILLNILIILILLLIAENYSTN